MSPIAISPAGTVSAYYHYDVILVMTSFATEAGLYPHVSNLRRSQPTTKPAILVMTLLATELATPSVRDVRIRTPYRV